MPEPGSRGQPLELIRRAHPAKKRTQRDMIVWHDGMSPPLAMRKLRDLDLVHSEPGSSAYLYSASGLVAAGGELYVVADDELHLARFPAAGPAPGTLLRLLPGDLPQEAAARKREKADLEILLRLPPMPGYECGALLALGSGSRSVRERGALLALDETGSVKGDAVEVNAAPLYRRLAAESGGLNLEGGWLHGGRLRLLQRGNRGPEGNTIIDLDFAALAGDLAQERVLADLTPLRVTPVDLGGIGSVGLTFTDACGLQDGSWLFSAVAEDTSDAYLDGDFSGAVVGLAMADARIVWRRPLEPACKVEGIFGERTEHGLRVLCVTDADNRFRPAQLLEIRID